jgi:hypothetical protein
MLGAVVAGDLLGGLLLDGSCHGDCMAKVIPG